MAVRLTERDVKLVRDVALSHVLSRDQIIRLGYFGSITRANTRLRELKAAGYVRVLETPFFAQSLYVAGRYAPAVVGERIAQLVNGRAESPRFLQHALAVTNVRLYLLHKGATAWLFEVQGHCTFNLGTRSYEVRPDGIAVTSNGLVVVEVDLGHVTPSKFREKLLCFERFMTCGAVKQEWDVSDFRVLTVTSGKLRASRLANLVPRQPSFHFRCDTFEALGISCPGTWS